MGPYVFIKMRRWWDTSCAFASLQYGWQWRLSRRDSTAAVFSCHCALCALLSASLVGMATATEPATIHLALRWRATAALLILVTSAQMFSRLTGLRAHAFLIAVNVFFPVLAAINAFIVPLQGELGSGHPDQPAVGRADLSVPGRSALPGQAHSAVPDYQLYRDLWTARGATTLDP